MKINFQFQSQSNTSHILLKGKSQYCLVDFGCSTQNNILVKHSLKSNTKKKKSKIKGFQFVALIKVYTYYQSGINQINITDIIHLFGNTILQYPCYTSYMYLL